MEFRPIGDVVQIRTDFHSFHLFKTHKILDRIIHKM